MQLKTVLNHVERHKSFVYQEARWANPETQTALEIPIEPRANGRAICSGCGQAAPGCDRLAERRFEYVPLWQMAVDFVSAMRRVACPNCGVRVEQVPWCDGTHSWTTTYRWFLAGWAKRLLWIGKDRTAQTLLRFFRRLGPERSSRWKFVCSDMWRADLKVIARKAASAVHVLDRFHILQKMNKALDEVRASEAKRLQADGYEPVLKHSRWCLWKRPENLTDKQTVKLSELLKKMARTLRNHRELILNWFRAKGAVSAGTVEGLNNKVKLTTRKSYGFRTYEAIETALYHNLGALPEPEFTHRFW